MNTPVSVCLMTFKILYRTLVVNYSLSLINLIEKCQIFLVLFCLYIIFMNSTRFGGRLGAKTSPRCKNVASVQRRAHHGRGEVNLVENIDLPTFFLNFKC